jgi:hypothetical protein
MFWKLKKPASVSHAAVHVTGAAVACTAAGAFFFGLYAPWCSELADRRERIAKVTALTGRGELIAETHRQMAQRLAELDEAAERTHRRMPRELSAGQFIELSTALAGELGVDVEQYQTETPQIHGDIATIDVSCRLVGSFASLCRYFAAIDQLPQVSRVGRLDLTRSPDPEAYPAQVTFQLYYQLDPHDKEQQGETLMKGAERDRIGATRGKLALIGVLAVVLVYVLASNFRGSTEKLTRRPSPHRSRAAEIVASRRAMTPAPAPTSTSPFGDFAADADWPEPSLDKLTSFDPLAAPPWMAVGEQGAVAADDPGAKSLEQLQQSGNAIIFVAGSQRVARIGSQDYHVGDMVGKLQITDISSQGIVLSEPTGDAAKPE